jgi:hypothetical protein
MKLPSYFEDFLQDIRPTENQNKDYKDGHTRLRQRLNADATLKPLIVSTFLQGSYRRATAVKPKSNKRADVDVIVVTRLSKEEYTPEKALDVFVPFLDTHYKGKWELQGRSFGISLSYVDLDLVITAAPSESQVGILEAKSLTADFSLEEETDWRLVQGWIPHVERVTFSDEMLVKALQSQPEWKTEPLYIPNREAECWEQTHPLEQIRWTRDKNKATNGHYVNVVKAIKWWRRVNHATPKYPKGYPVEHLVGVCCPDGITSVAEGVVSVLETIVSDYASYAEKEEVPFLEDHGVPTHNVMGRVDGADFAEFYEQVKSAADLARTALDEEDVKESALKWRELFGSCFPEPPQDSAGGTKNQGGFTPRTEPSAPSGGRYA